MKLFSEIVAPWLLESDSDDLIKLKDNLIWLQKELYDEYEPNRYESFDDCLADWLKNVDDEEDRKSLFRILNHLFFIGKQQFDSLCRSAYSDQTMRWIIDVANIDITSPDLQNLLDTEIEKIWFCPITDSMRINSFLKLNGLTGFDHRPDWRSLEEFGDKNRLTDYVNNNGIRGLVLLEDFVGSGNQMRTSVEWAADTLPNIPILVVPLVCCPEGVTTGTTIAQNFQNVTFSPTLTLRPELFLGETPHTDEPEVFPRVRDLIGRVRARLNEWEYYPFGYESTGALVALYSNCPDNTLPIIHHRGHQWTPLFSRVRRN